MKLNINLVRKDKTVANKFNESSIRWSKMINFKQFEVNDETNDFVINRN